MPKYDHLCKDCGLILVETDTISEYEEFEKEFGRSDTGNMRIPCPSCGEWAERDYSNSVPAGIVRGGYKHQYSKAYRAGAEEEWVRNEVNNSKMIEKRGGSTSKRPYTNYYLKEPEKAGFKRVSDTEANQKADNAKKTLGKFQENVDRARKR